MSKIAFISGHLDLTMDEFLDHYVPRIIFGITNGHNFIVGDARGADTMAQDFLNKIACHSEYETEDVLICTGPLTKEKVVVYHMFTSPRNNVGGFNTVGEFTSDEQRDYAMTNNSDYDIAWVRKGREKSGTAKNIMRRN